MGTVYAIDALDVLVFRDARPFEAGETHLSSSVFPPPPPTVLGMLRAALLEKGLQAAGTDFDAYRDAPSGSDAVVDDLRMRFGHGSDSFGTLRMRGPFVYFEGDAPGFWFPPPLDAVQDGRRLVPLRPAAALLANQSSSGGQVAAGAAARQLTPLGLRAGSGREPEAPGVAFLHAATLVSLLADNDAPVDRELETRLVYNETRTGIQLDERKVTVPGMLYSQQVVRPAPGMRLVVDVEGDGVAGLGDALRPLGGEGRMAWTAGQGGGSAIGAALAELESGAQGQELREAVRYNRGRFKLYLATPAIFARGWLPDGIDPVTLEGTFAGRRYRLVSAAIGKAQQFSGWDLLCNRPKPMRSAVPAGSVYFLEPTAEISAGELADVVEALFAAHHVRPYPCDPSGATGYPDHQGFGVTLVGSWSHV